MSYARKMFAQLNRKQGKSFIRIKTATNRNKRQPGDWNATIKIKIAKREWDSYGWQGFLTYDADSYSVVHVDWLKPFHIKDGFKDKDGQIDMFAGIQFGDPMVKPGKYVIARIYFEGKAPERLLQWKWDRKGHTPITIGMLMRKTKDVVRAIPLIAVDSDGTKHKVIQP